MEPSREVSAPTDSATKCQPVAGADSFPIQGELDFESGCTDGYKNWLRQQEERLEAIREEWGLPVGLRVRIKLKDLDGEIEGKLELVEQPVSIDRSVPLHLRVLAIDVFLPDIEYCVIC